MTRLRVPLLAIGAVALASAGWGGLSRLGLLPAPPGDAASSHGVLMVSGFVGTLIALERSIVVRTWWSDLAPVLSAAGALGIVLGVAAPLPALVILGAALVFVAMTVRGGPASPSLAMAVMTLGATSWALGAALVADGRPPSAAAPWWIAFLVLTVSAERMELSRALRPSRAALAVFLAAIAVLCAGTIVTLVDLAAGLRVAGAGVLVLAGWSLLRDVAPKVSRAIPLPRYIATTITLSYVWLAMGGVLLLGYDGIPAGARWDATVHALLVGYVLGMIVAHGPIILPAITGVAIGFTRALYAPLVVLQLSVAARVGGDVLGLPEVREWGGLLNGVALVMFFGTMAASARRRRPVPRPSR